MGVDPTGPDRLRGFRAPGADPGERGAPAMVAGPSATAEVSPPSGDESVAAPRASSWRWMLVAGAVLVIAIAVIASLAFRLGSSSSTTVAPSATPTPAASATPLAVPDLYGRVAPSVVLITTSKGSLGTGVIVNDTGTVLTAQHVIAGGGTISLVFADGTKATAEVAGADPKIDIATLTPNKLPEVVVPAILGGGLTVGSDVVAIGNPLGLRASTTTGIVSGLERRTKTKTGPLSGLIQFDAAVNPGSSGGPLLNAQGLLVGVVVSIADPGGDDAFAGIGFAVPIGAALSGGSGDGTGGGPQL